MTREVDLISYLPPFLAEYKEITAALEAENPEFHLIWNMIDEIYKDLNLSTATERGVRRWEKILGILPDNNESIENRKFTIFSRLNEMLPFTRKKLEKQLSDLCGEGNYSIRIDNDRFTVEILVGLSSISNINDILRLLERTMPANMIISLKTIYTRFSAYSGHKWSEFNTKTFKQLREEEK